MPGKDGQILFQFPFFSSSSFQPKRGNSHTHPLWKWVEGFLEAYICLLSLTEGMQPKGKQNGCSWGKTEQSISHSPNRLYLCTKDSPVLPYHVFLPIFKLKKKETPLTRSINPFRNPPSYRRTSKLWFCFVWKTVTAAFTCRLQYPGFSKASIPILTFSYKNQNN